MNAALLILVALVVFAAGYVLYGGFLARRLGIRPDRPTPAHTMTDGVDYIPARPQVLMGHHFSSIAGAAPIIGPIVAATWGWLPVYLWILVGGLFMGAVHDLSALVVSVRHHGRSIGEVIEKRVGRSAKILFLLFAWSALLLVIAVFVSAVAQTFHKVPAAGTASSLLIGTAVLFGLAVYRLRLPLLPATLGGIVLIGLTLVAGHLFPLALPILAWKLILLGYIFVASVAPVWILLQPRDFLNSFLLYALMVSAILGVLLVHPRLELPAYSGFSTDLGPLFPILFVTVACGALSGFHSLVSSGTTAKQLASEAHARPVAMGSMLIESLLAISALVTAAILARGDYEAHVAHGAIPVFAGGIGGFLETVSGGRISLAAGITFASVAVAEFALTSLDTATRIARFAFQELLTPLPGAAGAAADVRRRLAGNRYLATTVTVVLGGAFALSGSERTIWPLFGAANQLLAALAFLAVLAWMTHRARPTAFLLLPTAFMYVVTLSALSWKTWEFAGKGNWLLAGLALLLALLALVLLRDAVRSILAARREIAAAGGRPLVAED